MKINNRNIRKVLCESQMHLKAHGVDSFKVDSYILLSKVLKLDNYGDLLLYLNKNISLVDYNIYQILLKRRLQHEPIAYIVNNKSFWKQNFIVGKEVLIPRPETELIIEVALQILTKAIGQKLNILDLGTGSGCIILSLLLEFKSSRGIAIDYCNKTLEIAKINAGKFGICDRVVFLKSDWFAELNPKKKFDVIVSNPPYICIDQWRCLKKDVKYFEPKNALTDNKDGLKNYKIIAKNAVRFMRKNSILILEIGYNQEERVKNIFTSNTYKIKFYKDLQKINRVALVTIC